MRKCLKVFENGLLLTHMMPLLMKWITKLKVDNRMNACTIYVYELFCGTNCFLR